MTTATIISVVSVALYVLAGLGCYYLVGLFGKVIKILWFRFLGK